jgi:hypothetical protein
MCGLPCAGCVSHVSKGCVVIPATHVDTEPEGRLMHTKDPFFQAFAVCFLTTCMLVILGC